MATQNTTYPTLTEREAQAQGYTYCIAQGSGRLECLGEISADLNEEVYFVCNKEPYGPTIDAEGLKDVLKDHFNSLDEFAGDDDGIIDQELNSIPLAHYESFAKLITDGLSAVNFYNSAGIRLVPEPEDDTE